MSSQTDKLRIKLSSLVVFRPLLSDEIISALCRFLESKSVSDYSEFVYKLYEANGGDLSAYIQDICVNSDNIYSKAVAKKKYLCNQLLAALKNELEIFQEIADLKPEMLKSEIEWNGFLPDYIANHAEIGSRFFERVKNISVSGYGVFSKYPMYYINDENSFAPVKNPDPIGYYDLFEYKEQKLAVYNNTMDLASGKPTANLLLTGDAGTGKSSTVKAVCNCLFGLGIRVIEVRKNQLFLIPKVLDELSDNPLKFVIFIDDLSFTAIDDNFNALKAALEGSLAARSKNVVIYATSNRRHIIKENFSDREGDDIHRNDTVQEIISLSARFGQHIVFQKPDKNTYLSIVSSVAAQKGVKMPEEELFAKAERFALERGSRSARLARQFVDAVCTKKI